MDQFLSSFEKQFSSLKNRFVDASDRAFDRFDNTDTNVKIGLSFASGLFIGMAIPFLRQRVRRYDTVDHLPIRMFNKFNRGPTLKCIVKKVSDGDTLRLRHVTLFSRHHKIAKQDKLSEKTLQIRLAGIDAPETAKFGEAGQPLGVEATEYLRELLPPGKVVRVKCLSRDQYGRAVANLWNRPFWWPFQNNISVLMLRAGFARIYSQAGAEYGGTKMLRIMQKAQRYAKRKKRGIWKLGKKAQTPAEYKAAMRS